MKRNMPAKGSYEAQTKLQGPIYKHDCVECVYMGTYSFYFSTYDLYYHGKDNKTCFSTVIARYGNESDQYNSGLRVAKETFELGRISNPLAMAYLLAYYYGYIDKNTKVIN